MLLSLVIRLNILLECIAVFQYVSNTVCLNSPAANTRCSLNNISLRDVLIKNIYSIVFKKKLSKCMQLTYILEKDTGCMHVLWSIASTIVWEGSMTLVKSTDEPQASRNHEPGIVGFCSAIVTIIKGSKWII